MFVQMVSALDYIHSSGILHRDLALLWDEIMIIWKDLEPGELMTTTISLSLNSNFVDGWLKF